MIYVTKSSLPPMEEYINEISDMWDSHWLTNMGEKHEQLRKELPEFIGGEHVDLFTNGHMALEMVLQALDLKGEVITTPFTFASTTHAIVRNNLTPVFCDINPEDYTIDANKIEELITPNTSAILPVHVYGNICDIASIEAIAKKHGLKVIYDAAHAFAEIYKSRKVGDFGDASMFSFHATKVFNTIEGGAVTFSDEAVGKRLYQLKNFGIKDEETVNGIGANAKMNEFCAAMGLCNLRHLRAEIAKRKVISDRYRERLAGVPGLKLNKIDPDVEYNYSYFPIVIDEKEFGISRDELHEKLKADGFFTRKYFYPITSSFDCYKGRFNPESTPVALEISKKVLTLPLYADLDEDNAELICNKIKEYHIDRQGRTKHA